jgi:hypothetical protein
VNITGVTPDSLDPSKQEHSVCREELEDQVVVILYYGSSFTFDTLTGGIIVLWKSVVITVKVEIGGVTVQIDLREVTDKRRLIGVFIDTQTFSVLTNSY